MIKKEIQFFFTRFSSTHLVLLDSRHKMDPSCSRDIIWSIIVNYHYRDLCQLFYQVPAIYLTYIHHDASRFWRYYLLSKYNISTICNNITNIRYVLERIYTIHDYRSISNVPPLDENFWQSYLENHYHIKSQYYLNFRESLPQITIYDYAFSIHKFCNQQFVHQRLIHYQAFNRCFSYDILDDLKHIQDLITIDPTLKEAYNEYGSEVVDAYINKDLSVIYNSYLSTNLKFQSFRTSDAHYPIDIHKFNEIVNKYTSNSPQGEEIIDLYHHPDLGKIVFEYQSLNSQRYIVPFGQIQINYDCQHSFQFPRDFYGHAYQELVAMLYDNICPVDNCCFL